jgi:ribulose-phosphate 3-epimerase
MKECVPKVSELRTRFPTKDIQVDGGVGPGTVGCCARAGEFFKPFFLTTTLHSPFLVFEDNDADSFALITSPPVWWIGSNVIVAGTALFGAENPKQVVETFKKAVDDSKPVWGTDKALEDA